MTAPAQTMADSVGLEGEGWIAWGGGEKTPVPENTEVEVRFRDDEGLDASDRFASALCFRWWHDSECANADIVAYRVVQS